MVNKEQIIKNVKKLENSGVPKEKIQEYVQSAQRELSQPKKETKTFGDIGEKYLLNPLSKFFGIEQGMSFVADTAKKVGSALAQLDPEYMETISTVPGAFEHATGQSLDPSKELKGVAGQALKTAANIAPFSKGMYAIKAASKLSKPAQIGLRGTGIGAARGAGESLIKDESFTETVKDALIGGAISGVTSYLMSSIFHNITKTSKIKAERLTGRALKPSKTRVASDIRKGTETIAAKITKEGYKGNNAQIFTKAVKNKTSIGNTIGEVLKTSDKTIQKKNVVNYFNKTIKDKVAMSVLEPREVKAINNAIAKIPENMSAADANKYKIYFAKLIPKSAWIEGASSSDSFKSELFKGISGGFRKEIEKAVPSIGVLNEKWAIANDVTHIVDKKLAENIIGGGFWEMAKHGPLAIAVSLISQPFVNTSVRTANAQLYYKLAQFTKEELVEKVANILTLRLQ